MTDADVADNSMKSEPASSEEPRDGAFYPENFKLPDDADIGREWLDFEALKVVLRLRRHGYIAYFVGGCVRDILVGRVPKDYDVATNATPEQVKDLFKNSRFIGRRFRIVHVYFKGGKTIEVATFRATPVLEASVEELTAAKADEVDVTQAELEAEDDMLGEPELDTENAEGEGDEISEPAKPNPVIESAPVAEPEVSTRYIAEDNTFGTEFEDARRRDFTMNGLFYDVMTGKVIDHVGGKADLVKKQIRTIGDPHIRMHEDPVRLLRAIRFAAKLGFEVEPCTYAAMEAAVEDLPQCSKPRLLEETFRLLRGGSSQKAMQFLLALDALKFLLPALDEKLKSREDKVRSVILGALEAMDSLVACGAEFDDSKILSVILIPWCVTEKQEIDTTALTQRSGPTHDMLVELMRNARLPRRMAERCRMLLFAQPILAGMRKRKGGLDSFRSHPLFADSLDVFEVFVKATGQNEDLLQGWRGGGALQTRPNATGGKRRRRRSPRRPGAGPNPSTSG